MKIFVDNAKRAENGIDIILFTSAGRTPRYYAILGVCENVCRCQFGEGDLNYLLDCSGGERAFTVTMPEVKDMIKNSESGKLMACPMKFEII